MVGRNTGEKSKKDMLRVFARRKSGIIKKADELSKLCGVSVGVVIFGPDQSAPHVWPQDTQELNGILGRYLNVKKNVNAVGFGFGGKVGSEEKGFLGDDVDHVIDGLSRDELVGLVGNLDEKIAMVNSRIETMKSRAQNVMQHEEWRQFLNDDDGVGSDHQLCSGGTQDTMIGDFVGHGGDDKGFVVEEGESEDTCLVDDDTICGFSIQQLVDFVVNFEGEYQLGDFMGNFEGQDQLSDFVGNVDGQGQFGDLVGKFEGQDQLSDFVGNVDGQGQFGDFAGKFEGKDQLVGFVSNFEGQVGLAGNFEGQYFVDGGDGMREKQEVEQSSWPFYRLTPWEKMLM